MTINPTQIYNAGNAAQWRRIVFGDNDETITIPSTVVFTGSVTIPANVGNLTITGSADGTALTITGGGQTGSSANPAVALTTTWNTSGTPTLLKFTLTDTASNAASKFLDFIIGPSTSVFSVSKAGVLSAVGASVVAGSLANGANALSVTGTHSTNSGAQQGVSITITGAGNSGTVGNTKSATLVTLAAGYTGAASSVGVAAVNNTAGTANDPLNATSIYANTGVLGISAATTTGACIGTAGRANGGDVNYGGFFRAITDKSNATNIGVAGYASQTSGTPVQIGGFFGIKTSVATYTSAALMCDNGASTSAIFVARDNGTACFTIADGGTITATSLAGTGSRAVVADANGVLSAP